MNWCEPHSRWGPIRGTDSAHLYSSNVQVQKRVLLHKESSLPGRVNGSITSPMGAEQAEKASYSITMNDDTPTAGMHYLVQPRDHAHVKQSIRHMVKQYCRPLGQTVRQKPIHTAYQGSGTLPAGTQDCSSWLPSRCFRRRAAARRVPDPKLRSITQ